MRGLFLEKKLVEMVSEDLHFCDITTAFTPDKTVSAEVRVREDGVVSGIEEASVLFRLFNISAQAKKRDGEEVKKDEIIFTLKGSSRDILVVERTALNLLSRMSGIATTTRKYVDFARKANPKIKVAATRKTTPLLTYFEKKAVKAGGGDSHRMSLEDEVLIKNNHLKLFRNIKEAVETARKETSFTNKIEVEVSNTKDALVAAEAGADIIMFDNMQPSEIKKAVTALQKNKLREKVILEASGGITLQNIAEYAKTGVDVISVGALTHSAPALNINLRIK